MKISIRRAITFIHAAKRWMSLCVLAFMMIIVAASIVELGIILFMDIFDPPTMCSFWISANCLISLASSF
ncbi:hypothetical protein IT774_11220 [Salinimonas marina]|uniref:Uncharacterized protein n=1 Tax=Salinimonas marina TaxID=2785918 RepID=A0A7S9DVM1_9ALTE|nr:hypothetical protein [Salinimonas marina]QPG04766.1 hypothetical protein IT774_11220 [Salinimonas marina]